MKISKVEICNFKGYSGITKFNFNNNMVYISGENNVGKSSLFEAINLVVNGNNNDFLEKKNKCSDKPMFVNLEFSGKDIPKIIEKYAQGNKKNVFKKYIFEKFIFSAKRHGRYIAIFRIRWHGFSGVMPVRAERSPLWHLKMRRSFY